jgi:hypothetical protein
MLTITQTFDGDYRLSTAMEDAHGALWPIVKLEDFRTSQEAGAAYRAATAAADRLTEMFGTVGVVAFPGRPGVG